MITLYDLVFSEDRRPSPFCWRAKLALKHKGLTWRDEPMGFTEKQKIAFAQSQTVPVIHDGTKVVKDSWAIAEHLERTYPDKTAVPERSRPSATRASSTAGSTPRCMPTLFPMVVGDLVRARAAGDRDYFRQLAQQAARHERLRRFPEEGAREGRRHVPGRAGAGAARPQGPEVPVRRGSRPIPTTSCSARFCGRAPSARAGTPGEGRSGPCLARAHARPVRRHGRRRRRREIRRRRLRPADGAARFLDLVERRRGLGRRRHEVAPALSRDHLRLRRLPTL